MEFRWYLGDVAWSFTDGTESASSIAQARMALSGILWKFNQLSSTRAEPLTDEEKRLNDITEEHLSEIFALFRRLDGNGNGQLSSDEYGQVVAEYQGDTFDEKQFLEWYVELYAPACVCVLCVLCVYVSHA